ncbi:hypothetical protein F5X68DRAFT_258981 [Plectosphaerella plurivora]|uniref:N-acetyltransferase domain-containing protein n=1 Tax=Plectosphaerella plurivora TaxID=936078 RepID=A0A9P9AB38_9PEZI|nr:hypothetical protein F5X68DRAFT_258981 [Plectosphaerella plurivora]
MSSHAIPPADSGSAAGQESPPALTPASDLLITQITCHEDLERALPSLRLLLQECVNVDPSSSALCFLAPISDHDTDAYWRSLWPQISANPPLVSLFVITKRASDGAPNLANAEVLKLLISSTERGQGLGHLLMRHVEAFARDSMNKSVLLLDTATGTPARAFYLKSGWTEWGVCPTYAAYADGTLGDCSFFIKQLKPVASGR